MIIVPPPSALFSSSRWLFFIANTREGVEKLVKRRQQRDLHSAFENRRVIDIRSLCCRFSPPRRLWPRPRNGTGFFLGSRERRLAFEWKSNKPSFNGNVYKYVKRKQPLWYADDAWRRTRKAQVMGVAAKGSDITENIITKHLMFNTTEIFILVKNLYTQGHKRRVKRDRLKLGAQPNTFVT